MVLFLTACWGPKQVNPRPLRNRIVSAPRILNNEVIVDTSGSRYKSLEKRCSRPMK
jgi:hypothetical protein